MSLTCLQLELVFLLEGGWSDCPDVANNRAMQKHPNRLRSRLYHNDSAVIAVLQSLRKQGVRALANIFEDHSAWKPHMSATNTRPILTIFVSFENLRGTARTTEADSRVGNLGPSGCKERKFIFDNNR